MKIAIFDIRTLSKNTTDLSLHIHALPFGEAECRRLLAIRSPERAAESLGALLALQELIPHPFCPALRRAATGKPYLNFPGAPAIGLAHTQNLAVAIVASACEENVGIDLEELRPFARKIQIVDRFFTEQEQKMFATSQNEETFFKIWTAKEATAKMNGGGLSSLLSNQSESTKHTCHFRVEACGVSAILCLASEQPPSQLEWLLPPTITVKKL